jgi:hypothetical protein
MHKDNYEIRGVEPTLVELTHCVRDHFKLDWQRTIFDSAVASFNHDESPLRLKAFALALGELARISQEQVAPKEKIIACEWFEQSTDLREEDGVTRAQRVKYAVQGELHDDFVVEQLHVDVQSTVKECLALIDELNKCGNSMEQSLDIPEKTEDLEAIRALGTFDQFSKLIQERHDSLLSDAADAAREYTSPDRVLYDAADEQLNRLSMHVSDDDVDLDSLTILSVDPDWILYKGRGRVYARLQYDSDSDVELYKGDAIYDIYSFECSFESDTGGLNEPTFVQGSMKIDTDSFSDDQHCVDA